MFNSNFIKDGIYFILFIIFLVLIYQAFIFFSTSEEEIDVEIPEEEIDFEEIELDDACSVFEGEAKVACMDRNRECDLGDDDCFYKKGVAKMDLSFCREIQDTDLRNKCIAIVDKYTILTNSVLEGDITLCDAFEDVNESQDCKNNYIISTVANTGYKAPCANITDERVRNVCLKQ